MPKTISTTVYAFDELTEKAKDTARQWYREYGMTGLEHSIGLAIRSTLEANGCEIAKIGVEHREELYWKLDRNPHVYFKGTFTLNEKTWNVKAERHHAGADIRSVIDRFMYYGDDLDAVYDAFEAVLKKAVAAGQEEYKQRMSNDDIDENLRIDTYTFKKDGTYFAG